MNKKSKRDIRIRVMDSLGNTSYITVENGKVGYCTAGDIPLALSNMFGEKAAEVRFALSDAKDGHEAIKIVRQHQRYARTVELI